MTIESRDQRRDVHRAKLVADDLMRLRQKSQKDDFDLVYIPFEPKKAYSLSGWRACLIFDGGDVGHLFSVRCQAQSECPSPCSIRLSLLQR